MSVVPPKGHRKAGSGDFSSVPSGGSKALGIPIGGNQSKGTAPKIPQMAQSAPVISWQPPPPPSARPRVPSFDPPPLELPSSPPISVGSLVPHEDDGESQRTANPTGGMAIGGKDSLQVRKAPQVYSRSLSNYSSSAPVNFDYLQQMQRLKIEGNKDTQQTTQTQQGPKVGPQGVTITGNKRLQSPFSDALSLSKSPTIFSILSLGVAEETAEDIERERGERERTVRGIRENADSSEQSDRKRRDDVKSSGGAMSSESSKSATSALPSGGSKGKAKPHEDDDGLQFQLEGEGEGEGEGQQGEDGEDMEALY